MAALAERVHDEAGLDPRRRPECDDCRVGRDTALEPFGARIACEHDRAPLEQGVVLIDRAAAGEHGDLRRLRRTEGLAQLGVRARGRWKDPLGLPRPTRARAEDTGPDEHDVRERAQESHEEAVRGAVPGDEVVRPRQRGDGDDAIQRRHEVRVEAVAREAEVAVVEAGELFRQRDLRKRLVLVQALERLQRDAVCRHRRSVRGKQGAGNDRRFCRLARKEPTYTLSTW